LIRQRQSTLIAAPTGSGKTLTAFLAVIDDLVHRGLECAAKACQTNLGGLRLAAQGAVQRHPDQPAKPSRRHHRAVGQMGLPPLRISTAVRTGDTPQKDRTAMRKTAPHILVTTPESLYVLLGSDSGRQMLSAPRKR
jgi:ATP-dependent Lhr-like helicase